MADATLVIDSRLETKKLENQLAKLNNDIERQTGKVKKLEEEYDRLNYALEDAKMQGRILNPDDVAATEQARLNLERAQITLERMQTDAAGIESKIEQIENNSRPIQQNLNSAKDAISHFEKRLKGVVKEVLIFAAFAAALRKMKSYIGEAVSTNEDFQSSLARLRGMLRTAFQPILDFVIPVLQTLIDMLNTAVVYIARFTSWLFGTTVEASSAAAKALYNQANATKAAGAAAEKAKQQMSGLDEMNKWQSESSGGGGGGADMADIEFPAKAIKPPEWLQTILDVLKNNVLEIAAAFAAWKISRMFTKDLKKNLGIVLAIVSAIKLAKSFWDAWQNGLNDDNFSAMLTSIIALVGGLALAFGTLGAAIGLIIGGVALAVIGFKEWIETGELSANAMEAITIGIMAIGAAIALLTGSWIPMLVALIASVVVVIIKYWDDIVDTFKTAFADARDFFISAWEDISDFFTFIFTYISNFFSDTWDGIKNVFSTVVNGIADTAKSVWDGIKSWFKSAVAPKLTLKYWQSKFENISLSLISVIKGGINGMRDVLNKFIDWVNEKLTWNLGDGFVADIARGLGIPSSFRLFKIPRIPALAQGAVIPANHEFLAVLGDQKQGTNIEAPEDLIRKIVREEAGAGTYTFIAQLDGRIIFKEVIDQAKLSRQRTGKNAFNLGGA